MKKIYLVVLVLLFVLVVSLPAMAGWTAVSLHPTGASQSLGYGISGGQQVGCATINGHIHASLWTGTAASWVDLNPAGASESAALCVSSGKQAGWAKVENYSHASVWDDTAQSWVDVSPGQTADSKISALSSSRMVGWSEKFKAASWDTTTFNKTNLNPPEHGYTSQAFGISGNQTAGYTKVNGICHAAIWNSVSTSALDLNPSGASESTARDTNGSYQVGHARIDGSDHASLWNGTAGSWIDLNPSGAISSFAYAIDEATEVGTADVGRSQCASLWNGTAGSWVNLHAFLPEGVYGSSRAMDVDVSGSEIWIIGDAFNTTLRRNEAILWHYTP